ncbi:MAG: MBL fold metallo-hydrolase [Deltaproteobacteria bacterium]|nr:MBL fold metallo-hydrolase [Deltaproteobacteria bacterium]MBN2687088.1 MBL fold metallo-hydrolase [Deltaproteobacteria bacterium]
MTAESTVIKDGIIVFRGKLSRNLLMDPIVSSSYFLEDGDSVIIFDPSCGRTIARRIEAYIEKRKRERSPWKKAVIIAGHSHMDHANNFYLIDRLEADERHIYVHEKGFENGRVKNEPVPFMENVIRETREYYNVYRSFPVPYNLLIAPVALIDALSPSLARKMLSYIGGIPWSLPVNGSLEPEPIKESDLQSFMVGDLELRGWALDDKFIFPTPGHSECSLSLFWPEKKALFISDADWIGNPVFVSGSVRDCIDSLTMMRDLAAREIVDLLLPAHGAVKEGKETILTYLDFHIHRLQVMRDEVLSAYHRCGRNSGIIALTRFLTQESPLFKTYKITNYPRLVGFVHNVTAVCLKEEGLL